MREARRRWGGILKVLTNTGATMRAFRMVYKVVEQTVLLYIREIWVVMGAILKILQGFHHRSTRRISGMTAKHVADTEWKSPPVVVALEAAVLYPTKEYIRR